jgi:FkbM family methyltransferase
LTSLRGLPVPASVARYLTFDGTIAVRVDADHSFLIDNNDSPIESDLFWRGFGGGWEAASLRVWSRLAPHALSILDVGANSGVYALVAKCLNPRATVIAFEPTDGAYARLIGNIERNGFDIQAVKKAVSDTSGTAVLYDRPIGYSYTASLVLDAERRPTNIVGQTVQTTSLDDHLSQNGVSDVDLVKMDVEGHELAALRGFADYLGRCRPSILIEILDDASGAAIWSMVQPLGYAAYSISEHRGLRRTNDMHARGDDRNFLLDAGRFAGTTHLDDLMLDHGSEPAAAH